MFSLKKKKKAHPYHHHHQVSESPSTPPSYPQEQEEQIIRLDDISNYQFDNQKIPQTTEKPKARFRERFSFCTPSKPSASLSNIRRNESVITGVSSSEKSNASSPSHIPSPEPPHHSVTRHLELVFDQQEPSVAVISTSSPTKKKTHSALDKYNQLTASSPYHPPRKMTMNARSESPSPTKQSQTKYNAMKTPGIAIPTPARPRTAAKTGTSFPHPLQSLGDNTTTRTRVVEQHLTLSESVATRDEDDDAAFLPDDFKPQKSSQQSSQELPHTNKTYSHQEVQELIQQAQVSLEQRLVKKHEQDMEDFERDVETSLMQHGQQWKQDAELEYKRLQSIIQKEQSKQQSFTQSMLEKEATLQNLQKHLAVLQQERHQYQSQDIDLEQQLVGGDVDHLLRRHKAETSDLRKQLNQSNQKLQHLQKTVSNMQKRQIGKKSSSQEEEQDSLEPSTSSNEEELKVLKLAKDQATQKVLELQSILSKDPDKAKLTQELLSAKNELQVYQNKLTDVTTELNDSRKGRAAGQVQLRTVKAEVESLQRRFQDQTTPSDETVQELQSELLTVSQQRDTYEKDIKVLRERQAEELEKAVAKQQESLQTKIAALEEQISSSNPNLEQALANNEVQLRQEFEEHRKVMIVAHEQRVQELESKVQQQDADTTTTTSVFDSIEDSSQAMQLQQELMDLKKEQEQSSRVQQDRITALQEELAQIKQQELVESKDREVKQALQEQINSLQEQLEETKESLQSQYNGQVQQLQEQVASLKDELKEASQPIESDKQALVSQLQVKTEELARLQREFEFQQEEAKNLSRQMILLEQTNSRELLTKLDELEAKQTMELHAAEDKAVTLQKKLGGMESTLQELQSKYEQESETSDRAMESLKQDNQKLQSQVQELESSHKEQHTELQSKLSDLEAQHVRDLEVVKASTTDEALVQELHASADAERAAYKAKIRQVRDEHGKEIEELISQLDLIEAEHNAKYKTQQTQVKEKDAVISALSSQLAESTSRLDALSQSSLGLETELDNLKEEVTEARNESQATKQDIVRLVAEHQVALEQEVVLRQEACEEAREEMIQRAEVRYEEANRLFRNLKKKYDQATRNIADLEDDLSVATQMCVDTQQQLETQELALQEELAQAKAAIATSNAKTAHMERKYQKELTQTLEEKDNTKKQLLVSEKTSAQIQATLAAVVAEKEKLFNEYNEMKAVCEELMSIVEGGAASA